ncbi:MAG TPA: phosphodiester glycosidase family protein [Candidatus Paceibacterota bacterium]|nr:phosphodiester glycosidase family protein [Verrucomicrobiota bacterium]HSA10383.1 phosphodiester glycosidase family protein [Candidatus Paceibacterota bacterium]
MKLKTLSFHSAAALAFALGAGSASSQWSFVAPGLDYREYSLPGPVRVFVARADRSKDTWTVDSMKGQGTMKGGHETVPNMAARYDDSVTFDGHRYAVKVAINGDYYNPRTGVPFEGQIMAGWFAKRFGEYSGISGFVWTSDRRAFLGGNVRNGPPLQRVVFADGATMRVDQLNAPRPDNSLALYTWHFAANTGTSPGGAEVLIRMHAPLGLGSGTQGQIVKVGESAGATPLPFNHVVLSAHGKAAAELLRHARAGQSLSFQLGLKDHGSEASGLAPQNWRNAYASIGGPKRILVNGKVPRDWEAKAKKYAEQGRRHGSVVKDPRTAIAFNERHLFFLVIDGRSRQSLGMTFTETGFFCRDELKVTDAILQDGGGSSTLWVDGQVKNTPSGKGKDEKYGILRAVSNGYFIAEVLPPKMSTRFQAGQNVRIAGKLRLGPGTTFGTLDNSADAATGTILPESLNGVFAKGNHWWLCRVGATDGWASLNQITAAP